LDTVRGGQKRIGSVMANEGRVGFGEICKERRNEDIGDEKFQAIYVDNVTEGYGIDIYIQLSNNLVI